MDVISRRAPMSSSSTLNPNAPMFVPSAYRTVEDFSNEWWALVQSSPWFRDYWLQENYQDPQNDPFFPDDIDDDDDVFSSDNIDGGDDHVFSSGDVDDLFADSHYPPNNVNTTTNTDTQTAVVEEEEEEEKDFHKELVSMGLLKWTKGRAPAKGPRFIEKAPKFVNVKVSPRAIQQPR